MLSLNRPAVPRATYRHYTLGEGWTTDLAEGRSTTHQRRMPAATPQMRASLPQRQARRAGRLRVQVDDAGSEDWWEHGLNEPGVVVIDSTQALLNTLASAGDRLVVLHYFAHWCGACRALHPKASQILAERSATVVHALVEYDSQKALAKRLGVKVLPFFQLYRGAAGKVDEFSATLTKVNRLREALQTHDVPPNSRPAGTADASIFTALKE